MRTQPCAWATLTTLAATLLAASSAAAGPVPAPAAERAAKPPIREDHISYGAERRTQMARYSERHYGQREWRLTDPDAIVLHFTATDSYSATFNTFDSNAPSLGEAPGVCSQYVVEQDGTIDELVPPRIRCRHTIGLNHRSIGVEMVQATGQGAHWADRQILERRPQARSAVRLVRWLQGRFEVRTGDVIGHSMANDSPYFKDLEGWRNDHSDWLKRDVKTFRHRLKR